jgi:hypothetical protein
MVDDFRQKKSELIKSDGAWDFLGIKHAAQYRTVAGVSSITSWIGFLEPVDDETLNDLPDYILSDTLEKDLVTTITVCSLALQETRYLPDDVQIGGGYGALPEGRREGAYLRNWRNFELTDFEGRLLYTEEMFSEQTEDEALAQALWFIVKDICDDGRMLSEDWYCARILYEYFREYPVDPNNAFLIGELYKELCVKQTYEGELSSYYAKLAETQKMRAKGTDATKKKADELRTYCVGLFAKMATDTGPRLMMAPAEVQARELRLKALEDRPDDFLRSGKPYSAEWFLRNIIEDRKLDIVEALERLRA